MGRFTEHFNIFGSEIVPIIAWNGRISPTSKVELSQRGKIPGIYRASTDDWVGMTDWTTRVFTLRDAEIWDTWPNANVGLRAKHFPAIDIDEDTNEKFVNAMLMRIHEITKTECFPVRYRANSARVLVPLKLKSGEDFVRKMRIAYEGKGDVGNAKYGAVEILGDGQQYLIAGVHPSGCPYQWRISNRKSRAISPRTRRSPISLEELLS